MRRRPNTTRPQRSYGPEDVEISIGYAVALQANHQDQQSKRLLEQLAGKHPREPRIHQWFKRRKDGEFRSRVIACDPGVTADVMRAAGVTPVSLDDLLRRSDFLSIHTPLLPSTRGLIGEAELAKMRPHAILINTSRGPVVDERDLVAALVEGRIGAAGLDVFEQEPLPADSPLRTLGNVVLTPHIPGYSDIFLDCFWRYSVESIIALSNDEWPRSVVNRQVQPPWVKTRKEWVGEPPTYRWAGVEVPNGDEVSIE